MTCAIGLDVGGTKIAGGVVSDSGEVLARRRIETRADRGGEAILSEALAMAKELMAEAKQPAGIGVAVAELVDLRGNITSSQTIQWRGLPVRERFSRLAPAVVESDSRAAAVGEARFGAGRPYKIFYFITVGTGIGGALVENGRVFAGARGSAGTIASAGRPSLEEIASGPALAKRCGKARAEEVTAAAAAGDGRAIEVVRSAGEALGVAAGFLVNALDPEALIVGGGLGSTEGLYWDSFVASARRHIWSDTNRDLPILQAERGPDAGFIGAAALALGTS